MQPEYYFSKNTKKNLYSIINSDTLYYISYYKIKILIPFLQKRTDKMVFSNTRNSKILLINILIILGYWGISAINYIIFNGFGHFPMPIWPAAGIAITTSFYFGWSIAPGIALGSILANHYSLGSSWRFAVCISIMNTIAPELAGYLLRRLLTKDFIFKNTRNILLCFIIALILTPMATAAGGSVSKYLLGIITHEQLFNTFSKWAMAHSLGTFIIGTPIFTYFINTRLLVTNLKILTSKESQIKKGILTVTLIFIIYYWLADTTFDYLWSMGSSRMFSASLFPTDNLHEIFMRIIVVITLIITSLIILKITEILIIQQNRTYIMARDLETTLHSIGDGVISTNSQGKITRINQIALKLTGYTETEALNQNIDEVLLLEDTETGEILENPIKKVLKTRKTYSLKDTTSLKSRDGSEYLITDSAAPIITDDKRLIGAIMVFRDITQQQLLQEKLQHSQRMDAIGQLAGGVAHDFNNMLGGIIGFSELLTKKVAGDPEAEEYLNHIINTADKAAGLTSKLLSFARKNNIPSTSIDIHEVISDSKELLIRTIDKRIGIQIFLNAEKHFIVGDSLQLQNIFINMGINAALAMENGGTITIVTEDLILHKATTSTYMKTLDTGDYIKITISDTGIGISQDNLEHIFEPFFTTRETGKGTGLGLSAVYGSIEQHKGDIKVISKENAGTTFTILLPAVDSAEKKPLKSDKKPQGAGNILVVDDEKIMRITASRILEEAGYTVSTLESGSEALKIIEKDSSKYMVILLDMIMPDMNGKECFKRMTDINPDIKVILASGLAPDQEVQQMLENGLCRFIAKPYRSYDLLETISAVCTS